jgi:hypothetical protein
MDNETPPAQQPAQPVQQPGQQPARRRPVWVLPAVLGSVLLVGVLAAAAVVAGPVTVGRADQVAVSDVSSLDALFEPTLGEPALDEPGPVPDAKDRPFKRGPRGKGNHPWRLRDGEKVVVGAVGSVNDGNLVVRKDDGAEVTVPTDDETRVGGAQNKQLSDLGAGERVVVKVGSDGVAAGVLAVRAHAAGTVTELDGDRATLVRPGGLSTVLDLSGVSERPAAGTVVVAVGTATDDGATLKVEQLKELPTLG